MILVSSSSLCYKLLIILTNNINVKELDLYRAEDIWGRADIELKEIESGRALTILKGPSGR